MDRRLILGVAAAMSLTALGAVAVDADGVKPGELCRDLKKAVAAAEAAHRPLVMIHVSKGCSHCARLEKAISGEAFRIWREDRQQLMFYAKTGELEKEHWPTRNFVCGSETNLFGFPYVGVFWPKEDGTTNRVAFSGRRGRMGVERQEQLSIELIMALDKALAGVPPDGKPHKTAAEILAASSRKIEVVAKDGLGNVSMRPASGIFQEGEKVTLDAKAKAGNVFMAWRGPDGSVVGHSSKMEVSGAMPGGKYTAEFRKLADCKPFSFGFASTSVCVRAGRPFRYEFPISESARPVKMRALRRLPPGIKLDHDACALTGLFRHPGSKTLELMLICFDADHTTQNIEVTLEAKP